MNRPATARSRLLLGIRCLLLASCFAPTAVYPDNVQGTMVVAGHGPERAVIERLARAFEQAHIGTAIDITWNRNFRTTHMVASGEADLAVAGEEEAGFTSTTIAWDGLAVIVNFSNPVKEVTKEQVASLFSGGIRDWSELDEKADGKVRVVLRPDDQNLNDGFEQSLGIVGAVAKNAERIRSDQRILSRVSGQLDSVSYLSLQAALEAVSYGISVRILLIDGVEPGKPTVASGRYTLKRPVVFLSRKEPKALTQAFVNFALSPAGQRIVDEFYVPVAR